MEQTVNQNENVLDDRQSEIRTKKHNRNIQQTIKE